MPLPGIGRFARGKPQVSRNDNDNDNGTAKNATDVGPPVANDNIASPEDTVWMSFDQQLDFSFHGGDASLDAFDMPFGGDGTAAARENPQKNPTPQTHGNMGLDKFKKTFPKAIRAPESQVDDHRESMVAKTAFENVAAVTMAPKQARLDTGKDPTPHQRLDSTQQVDGEKLGSSSSKSDERPVHGTQGYQNIQDNQNKLHSPPQDNLSTRILPLPASGPNRREDSANLQSNVLQGVTHTLRSSSERHDGVVSEQLPSPFIVQATSKAIHTPKQPPQSLLPAVTPSPFLLHHEEPIETQQSPLSATCTDNVGEVFEELKGKFLSDIRDIQDVQKGNATLLLQMEAIFATAYSVSLHDQAKLLDLLQQLEALEARADETIARFRSS